MLLSDSEFVVVFAEEEEDVFVAFSPLALCSCGLSFPVVTWFMQLFFGFTIFSWSIAPKLQVTQQTVTRLCLFETFHTFFYTSLNFAHEVN